jgi:hypothetical protein
MSGLMILVAGPYRSGTDGDPARIQANVDAMTRTSLELWRRGHLPVMGEWFALPLIEAAEAGGSDAADADAEIFHPVAERLLERCDGCLRIGGPSEGADRMVATARRLGKRVWRSVEAIPTWNPIRARVKVNETRSRAIWPGYRPDAWVDHTLSADGNPLVHGVHPRLDSPLEPGQERDLDVEVRNPEVLRPLVAGEVVDLVEGRKTAATMTILEDWRP